MNSLYLGNSTLNLGANGALGVNDATHRLSGGHDMEGSNSEFGAGEKLRHRQARSGGASSQKRGSFFGLYSGKQDVKGRESSRRGRGSSPGPQATASLGLSNPKRNESALPGTGRGRMSVMEQSVSGMYRPNKNRGRSPGSRAVSSPQGEKGSGFIQSQFHMPDSDPTPVQEYLENRAMQQGWSSRVSNHVPFAEFQDEDSSPSVCSNDFTGTARLSSLQVPIEEGEEEEDEDEDEDEDDFQVSVTALPLHKSAWSETIEEQQSQPTTYQPGKKHLPGTGHGRMSILEQGVTGMYRPGAAKIKAQRQQRHQVASPEPSISSGKLKNRQAARPGCTSQKRGSLVCTAARSLSKWKLANMYKA